MFGDALMSLSPAGCSPLAPALPQKRAKTDSESLLQGAPPEVCGVSLQVVGVRLQLCHAVPSLRRY